jgi:hypothetical protein
MVTQVTGPRGIESASLMKNSKKSGLTVKSNVKAGYGGNNHTRPVIAK